MKKRNQHNNDLTNSTQSLQVTNPESAHSVPASQKQTDWLGIVNMIISIIVGIGLAIFFNIRNGQLQIDNINLQAKLQEEYNSASLQITCPNIDCAQIFKVTNTGFGQAKSVNIIIALSSVPLPWTPYVNNINQFQLSVRPFSAPIHITLATNTSVNALPNNQNNAYILSLDNLGPQSSITVNISPGNLYNSIKNIIHGKKPYNAIVYFTASEIQTLSDPNNIHEIINDIIDSNFFGIAKFVIDASCSTCSGDTSYASYPTFKASTNNNDFIVSSNSETFPVTGTPQKNQNGVYSLAVSYTVDYMIPKESNQISIPSPLNIQVNNYGSDNQSIIECQVANCSNFSSG